jgi:hypothetical protein
MWFCCIRGSILILGTIPKSRGTPGALHKEATGFVQLSHSLGRKATTKIRKQFIDAGLGNSTLDVIQKAQPTISQGM